MDVGIDVDDKNRVTVWYFNNEDGQQRIIIDDELLQQINDGHLFKYENNQLIIDTTMEQVVELQKQIETLNIQLNESAPKVTEAMEYQLRNEPIPTDIQQTLNDRESWRTQISTLKEQINNLI